MKIELHNVSKKYGSQWVFQAVHYQFHPQTKYAIIGANGSGKSTLLKIIAGMVTANTGTVSYHKNQVSIPQESIWQSLSFCSPYLELPEEMTLAELLYFHKNLRALEGINAAQILQLLAIKPEKEIRTLSSGMKQRVKLALAFFTQSDLLLLDEPTAFFDEYWKGWYKELMQQDSKRTVLICSNEKEEYNFCEQVIEMAKFA